MENIKEYKVGTKLFHACFGMGVIKKILKRPKTSLRINDGEAMPEKYVCEFFLTSCGNPNYAGKIERHNYSQQIVDEMVDNFRIMCVQAWSLPDKNSRSENLSKYWSQTCVKPEESYNNGKH